MAKKNLHNLMSGIIGDNTGQGSNDVMEPQNNLEDASPKSNVSSTPRRGRPKKENDDTRTTLIISAELLRKIKYVSLMENSTLKDIVDDALSLYVSKWEQDNGKIRLPKK